jgi:putative mRNA 3-end processing factor
MDDPRSAVLMVGYQIPGTPGRDLLENGFYDYGIGPKRVKAKYHLFDFSSHAGKEQLLNLGDSFSNASHIFTVHGEAEACESLATTLHKQYGQNAQVAENGQKIILTD